ncbi:MAG: carboxypeptidase M32 [Anaerolineae bacterium]|nr:carboxypeptidase M32 [Anaerolineae bacterium]
MNSPYQLLLEKVHEIHDIEKAIQVLSWDKETNMPAAGNAARVQQMTTLRRIHHRTFASDEMGELIEAAANALNGTAHNSNEASLIRYLRRSYADERKLPDEFVQRVSLVSGAAHPAWVQARAENNFALFRPHLERVVALNQEMADLYGYEDEKYDPLLDKFEHGLKTAELRAIFAAVKTELKPLLTAVTARTHTINDQFLHQHFPVPQQQEFARYGATAVGYDFSRGHLGTVVHPFATSFSRDDARITTRWNPDFLNAALFGTLHESGHAMYEQGTAPDLARTH